MNPSYVTLALLTFAFAPPAFAGVLQLEAGSKQIEGVTISKGGKMVVEGRTADIITVGAGLRTRIVNVYVGELLVNDKNKYACNEGKSLESLKDLNGIAVKLTFKRAIGMTDLQKAFTDGFKNNHADANNPAVKEFMSKIVDGGNIPNGAKLVFTGEKLADGAEAVTYENAAGNAVTVKGGAGFVRSIFSLWLGDTGSDRGLKSLRDAFVNCQI